MQRQAAYLGYSDFTNQGNVTYSDYLQAKEFEQSIRFGLREQTRAILASDTELAAAHYKIAEKTTNGLTVLSRDFNTLRTDFSSGLTNLNSTFEWGFSEILLSFGCLNDSLKELVRIARTPSQTWAFEQYEIARDEVRRALHQEALESVTRAIDGYGSNPGYRTEHRFHFLLATIRLGSFTNHTPKVVDLEQSEAAFLRAARYATHDFKAEAALAYMGAGRAAYANKMTAKAIGHYQMALKLDDSAELRYQLAKALADKGAIREALINLESAIRSDVHYSIKAAGEAEFQEFPNELDLLYLRLRDEAKALLQAGIAYLENVQTALDRFRWPVANDLDAQPMAELAVSEVATVSRHFSNTLSAMRHNSLVDYVVALKKVEETPDLVGCAFAEFRRSCGLLIAKQKQVQSQPVLQTFDGPVGTLSVLLLVILTIPIWRSCYYDSRNFGDVLSSFGTWVVSAIALAIAAVIAGAMMNSISRSSYDKKKRHLSDLIGRLSKLTIECNSLTPPANLLAAPRVLEAWESSLPLQESKAELDVK